MTDYLKAATRASEILIRYNVRKSPVLPLPILEQMDNVQVVTFAELHNVSSVDVRTIGGGKFRDSCLMIRHDNGKKEYLIAYNDLLPDSVLYKSLAVELGHVALSHTERSAENEAEANFFALHFLCPRPLIHLMQAISMRITEDLLASLTGILHETLIAIRRVPGVSVSSRLNRFVSNQFMPFMLNFFEYRRDVNPLDGSALVDFGTFMDNYKE